MLIYHLMNIIRRFIFCADTKQNWIRITKDKESFNLVQKLINKNNILSGHDISSGGLITCLLEMCFSSTSIGLDINLSNLGCKDFSKLIFSENTGIIIQSDKNLEKEFSSIDVKCIRIGNTNNEGILNIKNFE